MVYCQNKGKVSERRSLRPMKKKLGFCLVDQTKGNIVRLFWLALGSLLGIGLIGFANAQSLTGSSPGFHYFYKAGAGMDAHDTDLVTCAVAIRGLVNGSDAMTGIAASTGGGFFGALVGGVIDSKENRQGAAANIENCMAVKGWSVVGISEEQGELINALEEPVAIHSALVPLVEATERKGVVLRGSFANELATGDFLIGEAGKRGEISLSVRAVRNITDAAIEAAGKLKPPKPPKLERGVKAPKPIKTMKDDDLANADPSASYVVLRIRGSNRFTLNATSLMLHRLHSDGTEVVYDGTPVTAVIGRRKVAKTKDGERRLYDFVAKIPPGRWKIASISFAQFVTDLCFGAPAFDIGEGEAVFLGDIALGEMGGYPLEMGNLDLAKSILAPTPAIAAKVQAATYTNGFVSDCFGSYAYAYEVEGAAFIDFNENANAQNASASNEIAAPHNVGANSADVSSTDFETLEVGANNVPEKISIEVERRLYKPGEPAPDDNVANDLNLQQLGLARPPLEQYDNQ